MIVAAPPQGLVVGIHPTARGFGWAALESPLAPYNGALVDVSKDMNSICLRKIEQLLNQLQPETLVLEAFERRNSARTDRIARLCRAIVGLAAGRGIEVAIYTRRDIEICFATVGARTRHEIAEAVARSLPALTLRLPPKRPAWKQEDRRMALFASAALVLTHYRHEALWVLRERAA